MANGAIIESRSAIISLERLVNDPEGDPRMASPTLSPGALDKILQAQVLLTEAVAEAGLLPDAPEPAWKAQYRRWWTVLKAVQAAGGDLHVNEWRRLGIAHGYDPRGLGGFFNGAGATMRSQGDRRILTKQGERYIRQWEPEFGR